MIHKDRPQAIHGGQLDNWIYKHVSSVSGHDGGA